MPSPPSTTGCVVIAGTFAGFRALGVGDCPTREHVPVSGRAGLSMDSLDLPWDFGHSDERLQAWAVPGKGSLTELSAAKHSESPLRVLFLSGAGLSEAWGEWRNERENIRRLLAPLLPSLGRLH